MISREPLNSREAEPPYPPTIPGSLAAEDWSKARPSFDQTFMDIAGIVAKRGTCPRLQVGSVIAVDNRIIATGYNGSPSGLPHCTEIGCLLTRGEKACLFCKGTGKYGYDNSYPCHHCQGTGKVAEGGCKRTTHAEANALIQCAKMGSSPVGGIMYITHRPCVACAGLIITAGIAGICWGGEYRSDGVEEAVLEMFDLAGVAAGAYEGYTPKS